MVREKNKWCALSLCVFCALAISIGLAGCNGSSSSSPQKYEQLRYVAMGASDAVGIGAFPLDQGYVYRVRDGLAPYAEDVALYNLGISGKRSDYLEETELPAAIELQPDVLTLWAGPNDLIHGVTVEEFEVSLRSIFHQLRQETSTVIVAANLPDLTRLPRFLLDPDPDVTLLRIEAFNLAIARQASQYGVPFVDLFHDEYTSNWEYISLDGFHPSNQGHAQLAELYLELILQEL